MKTNVDFAWFCVDDCAVVCTRKLKLNTCKCSKHQCKLHSTFSLNFTTDKHKIFDTPVQLYLQSHSCFTLLNEISDNYIHSKHLLQSVVSRFQVEYSGTVLVWLVRCSLRHRPPTMPTWHPRRRRMYTVQGKHSIDRLGVRVFDLNECEQGGQPRPPRSQETNHVLLGFSQVAFLDT